MAETDPRTIVRAFVDRINAHDVDGIAALLTEDHEFIDIPGASFRGRENLRHGWTGYFKLFPDYRIYLDHVLVHGAHVILVGRSSGTLSEFGAETLRRDDDTIPTQDELQGPAIWTARVLGLQIAQWRVYWDTPDVRTTLGVFV